MIYVDGVPFSSPSSSYAGDRILIALLEHPSLVCAANLFKTIPEEKVTFSEESSLSNSSENKLIYIFQREYATVNPALVEFVGTDEATTCVGLVIRNRKSGMASVAHMDSPKIVDLGLKQMLALVVDLDVDADLDVHMVGGFDDSSYDHIHDNGESASHETLGGYSFALCSLIIEALQNSQKIFHIQTLCVLGHNTRRDSSGNACPVISGFLVETSRGSIIPANFNRSSRCPDEIVRRIRVTVSSLDPKWNGKLLETYDTHHDKFIIAPCSWSPDWKNYALSVLQSSDSEILLNCSTSPYAEASDFVENQRREMDYLVKNPDWRSTFPLGRPRIFKRTNNNRWIRCT